MARYYEESALLEFVKKYTPTIGGETTMECVERAIRNSPTADVVEVVRCQHCRYAHFVRSCSKYMCEKGCGELKYSTDFCNYGERKA